MKAILYNYLECPECREPLKALDVPIPTDSNRGASRAVCCGNKQCREYLKGGIAPGMVVELRDLDFEHIQ